MHAGVPACTSISGCRLAAVRRIATAPGWRRPTRAPGATCSNNARPVRRSACVAAESGNNRSGSGIGYGRGRAIVPGGFHRRPDLRDAPDFIGSSEHRGDRPRDLPRRGARPPQLACHDGCADCRSDRWRRNQRLRRAAGIRCSAPAPALPGCDAGSAASVAAGCSGPPAPQASPPAACELKNPRSALPPRPPTDRTRRPGRRAKTRRWRGWGWG